MTVRPEELARTLVARQRARLARNADRARVVRAAVDAFVSRAKLGRCWLIGSLAWGGFGERSDVDLVVEAVPSAEMGRLASELSEATDTEVDVLRIEDLPAAFQARVREQGILLRGA